MPPFSGKQKKEQLQAKRQRKRDEEERANALDREREKLREELVNRGEDVNDDVLEAHLRERNPHRRDPAHGRRAHRRERADAAAQQQHGEAAESGAGGGHDVRSVFAKESPAVLAARKQLSYQPIPFRATMPATGIPFSEWFAFPSKAAAAAADRAPPAPSSGDALAEQERRLERPLVATNAEALGGGSGSLVFPFGVELPSRGWHLQDGEAGGRVQAETNVYTAPSGIANTGFSTMDEGEQQQKQQQKRVPENAADSGSGGSDEDSVDSSTSADDENNNTEGDTHGDDRRAEALRIKEIEQTRFAAYVRCLDAYPLPAAIAGLDISSYERNIEVWQQLWRTVEISDVLVVVADARYPILHAHLGLLAFITRTHRKPCVIVLNKEDLVPVSTLRCWKVFLYRYLTDLGFTVEPPEGDERAEQQHSEERRDQRTEQGCIVLRTFTANPRPETAGQRDGDVDVTRRQKKRKNTNAKMYEKLRTGKLNAARHFERSHSSGGSSDESDSDNESDTLRYSAQENFVGMHAAEHALQHDKRAYKELAVVAQKITELLSVCRRLGAAARAARGDGAAEACSVDAGQTYATSALPCAAPRAARKNKKAQKRGGGGAGAAGDGLGHESANDDDDDDDAETDRAPDNPGYIHIGFIGHPNVGKSSLLNCIRGTKVVSVSATPGHTKHIQTIPIPEESLTLVDSPGLALPVFGVPRPLQAVLGTHQIAQTRDPQSGVSFLAAYLPIEKLYGLLRPDYALKEDEWSSYELCEAYAKKRGYFVRHGKGALDIHRAAIALLQEAYEGRLALFYAPPELTVLQSAWYRERIRPTLLLTVFGPPLN